MLPSSFYEISFLHLNFFFFKIFFWRQVIKSSAQTTGRSRGGKNSQQTHDKIMENNNQVSHDKNKADEKLPQCHIFPLTDDKKPTWQ